ncbi:MAG: SIMPL domain-containing protein [Patescibacteria group bacterium]
MNIKIKNCLGVSVILVLFILTSITFWYVYLSSKPKPSYAREFSVTGKSKMAAIPDIVQFSFTINSEINKELGDSETKKDTDKIIDFFKEHGVEDKDIKVKTSAIRASSKRPPGCDDYFSVNKDYIPKYIAELRQLKSDDISSLKIPELPTPNFSKEEPISKQKYDEYYKRCGKDKSVRIYNLTKNFEIKVREISKIESILVEILKSDLYKEYEYQPTITFIMSNAKEIQDKVRAEAILKAKEKAELIANQTGFKLGEPRFGKENIISPWLEDGDGMTGNISYEREEHYTSLGKYKYDPNLQEISISVELFYEVDN